MEFVAVIVATLAAYGFGAFWYIRMSKPWIKAAGIPVTNGVSIKMYSISLTEVPTSSAVM